VAGGPQVVPFFQKNLKPRALFDAERARKLIEDLDSPKFPLRQQAMDELEKMGAPVLQLLRKAADKQPSLEAQRRIVQLLQKLEPRELIDVPMGPVRAVTVLEQLGTPEARRLLATLAEQSPSAWLADEAAASVRRLDRAR